MAFIQSALSSSSETPNTVKFLSLNWLYAATTLGFSWRQGAHQLAQKSTNTYFPRNEERETCVPVVSGNVKSGACDGFILFFCSFSAVFEGNFADASLISVLISVKEKSGSIMFF